MRTRRSVLILVVGLCVFAAQPGVARAADENPYWRSDTNIPVETTTGEWSVSGDAKSAELAIQGPNLPAQQTRFVAGWITPWAPADSGYWEEGEMELFTSPATSVTATIMLRHRYPGEGWGRWSKTRLPFLDAGPGVGGGAAWAGGHAVLSTGPPSKIQYEWRLVGEIEGPARIDATITLGIN